MFDEPARKAISAALDNNWEQARKLNLQIIRETPENVNALNRLAQAHLQLGKLSQSERTIKKILKIDPLNSIAAKCKLKIDFVKLKKLELRTIEKLANPNSFIEEPGKTKLVALINICEPSFLVTLCAGEFVLMSIRKPKVVISTTTESYIGRLPDDLASRIISFEDVGNKYEAFIKSVTLSNIQIFIRETHTGTQNGAVSFPFRR